MRKVIAALDNSLAAGPVLATALELSKVLDAEIEALHVPVNGDRVARNAAAAAGVTLQTPSGPVLDRLIEAGEAGDVAALVLGARGSPLERRPLGGTALAVATSLAKPLVVVPPNAARPGRLSRVLVPLEGRRTPAHTPRVIVELAQGTELDVIVLTVLEQETLPLFTDQPQHEHPARMEEFLRRHCPWGIGRIRLEVRVGRSDELVPLVAEEIDVDIIALGWSQELEPGRAPVVRATLARGRIPVMLVPVEVQADEPRVGAVSGSPVRL